MGLMQMFEMEEEEEISLLTGDKIEKKKSNKNFG